MRLEGNECDEERRYDKDIECIATLVDRNELGFCKMSKDDMELIFVASKA